MHDLCCGHIQKYSRILGLLKLSLPKLIFKSWFRFTKSMHMYCWIYRAKRRGVHKLCDGKIQTIGRFRIVHGLSSKHEFTRCIPNTNSMHM